MKKVPLSIRVDPGVKEAAEKAAKLEPLSFTNLIDAGRFYHIPFTAIAHISEQPVNGQDV